MNKIGRFRGWCNTTPSSGLFSGVPGYRACYFTFLGDVADLRHLFNMSISTSQ